MIAIWKGAILADSIVLGVVTIPDGEVTELDLRGTYPRYSPTGHIVYATYDGWLMGVPFDRRSRRHWSLVSHCRRPTRGYGWCRRHCGRAQRDACLAWGWRPAGGINLVAVTRAGVERSILEPPGWYAHPRVSPDGRQVAVTVALHSRPGRIQPYLSDRPVVESGHSRYYRFIESSRHLAPRRRATCVHQVTLASPGGGFRWCDRCIVRVSPHRDWPRGSSVRRLDWPSSGLLGVVRGFGFPGQADIWLVHIDSFDKPRPFLSQAIGRSPRGLARRSLAGVCL